MNKNVHVVVLLVVWVFVLGLSVTQAPAAEVYFKNGDKITGEIAEQSDDILVLSTEAAGRLVIKKEAIDRLVLRQDESVGDDQPPEESQPQVIREREIAAGFTAVRGNTWTDALFARALINYKRPQVDEVTVKASLYYAETDKRMDAQEWYAMGRYAFSFGPGKVWYNFSRVEADHDKFADVHYRLIPAQGVGYWFSDKPAFKMLAELALGFKYTDYYREGGQENDLVAIPRLFFDWQISPWARFAQDVYIYPSLMDVGSYRLYSDSAMTFPITQKMSLRLNFIEEYNSDPSAGTERNDCRFVSAFVYSLGD